MSTFEADETFNQITKNIKNCFDKHALQTTKKIYKTKNKYLQKIRQKEELKITVDMSQSDFIVRTVIKSHFEVFKRHLFVCVGKSGN